QSRGARGVRRLVRRHGQAPATRSRPGGSVSSARDNDSARSERHVEADLHAAASEDSSDLHTWRSNRAARPKDLTDMDLPEYSVTDVKDWYRAERRNRRRLMREESVLDEDGEAFEKAYDQGMMLRLLRYLKPYRSQLVAGVGLLLLYSALLPAFPTLLARALDQYIVAAQPPYSLLTTDERLNGLTVIVVIYLGLRLISFVLRFGYTYLVSWL